MGAGVEAVSSPSSSSAVGPISLSSSSTNFSYSANSTFKTVTDALSTTVAALGSAAVVHAGGKAGAWVYEQGSSLLKWEIPKLGSAADRPATLKGSFVTLDSPPRYAAAIRTTFSIPNHSLANIRIGSVQIAGEGPALKVFKGILNVVEGDLEWRRF